MRRSRDSWTEWWCALTVLFIILLAPVFFVEVPPLLDYPNHLARAYLLSVGQHDSHLSQMYYPNWHIVPNLAIDVVLAPLITIIPVYIAGKVVISLALLLPVIGAIMFSRALFGSRTYWSLASCTVSANGLFLLGFLNFQLSIGIAFISAAAWIIWQEFYPIRIMFLASICGALLFFSHLMGLVFYIILIASYELHAALSNHRNSLAALAPNLAIRTLRLAGVVVPSGFLYIHTALPDMQLDLIWETWPDKIVRIATPFINYNVWLDLCTVGLVLLFLASCLNFRLIHAPPTSVIAFAILALCYAIMPYGLKGAGFVGGRIAVMLGFLLFSAVRFEGLTPRTARIIAASVLLIFALRNWEVLSIWRTQMGDIQELRDAIAMVTYGSRVLVAMVSIEEADPAARAILRGHELSDGTRLGGHTGALLVIERQAFYPFLFANEAQQPIAMRPAYREIGRLTKGVPDIRLLSERFPSLRDIDRFPLVGQWACCYDYVLVVESRGKPNFSDDNLELLRRSDYVALFRVLRNGPIRPIPLHCTDSLGRPTICGREGG
jgi:hypothetical protein